MKKWTRLIINLVIIGVLVLVAIWLYRYFTREETDEFQLENTPLKVELIKAIAELNTVSYRDEVVADSLEFYKSSSEKIVGNLQKITDVDYWKYEVRNPAIKRRLTLIVSGEVFVGFDLTSPAFRIEQNTDSIWVHVPNPEVLDVVSTPSKTEVFQENGTWLDFERKQLEMRAMKKIERNAIELKLLDKAKNNMEGLLQKLITDGRTVLIYFHD